MMIAELFMRGAGQLAAATVEFLTTQDSEILLNCLEFRKFVVKI